MALDTLQLVVTFTVIYVVLSLVNAYFLGQPGETHPHRETSGSATAGPGEGPEGGMETPRSPGDGVHCSACGAVNDPTFSFCRNCVAVLSGGSAGRHT